MQSRRAAKGLSNSREREEFFRFLWKATTPCVRDLVSKAGSEPASTGSKVETEAATGKKQLLSQTQEYRSSIPAPQLRKEVIGLYGYEILKTAKGFRIFAQDAIDK